MGVRIWVLSVLSLVMACGGSGNIPVPNADTVHHSDSTNSLPPTYTPPTGEAVVCSTVLDQTDGHTYPFQGLISNGKTITCTACPSGFNKLNDQWLWFAEDEDGNLTLDLKAAGYDMTSDELTFNGNTFLRCQQVDLPTRLSCSDID